MEKTEHLERQSSDIDQEMSQFVTFLIANESYGVEVLSVKEILGMTAITPVPNTLDFMKGVINLRGEVVPVVDMRRKFGLDAKEYDGFTVIIIVEVKKRLIGMIVDAVSDVADIPVNAIQSTPHFSAQIETDFIRGIGQVGENLIIILDVDRILTTDEFNRIEEDI